MSWTADGQDGNGLQLVVVVVKQLGQFFSGLSPPSVLKTH